MVVVRTDHSAYLLDKRAMTATRLPAHGHLRRDGEAVQLLAWPRIEVGQPLAMLLVVREDGVRTLRHTSPVRVVIT